MLIRSDKAPRLWIKMSFFITKLTPVYNRRPGMTYVPVILAREQRGVWGEHGLVRVALCFTIIRAWLKWAHEGVIWIFTIEMNSFGQLHWDRIKCADTSFPHVPWIPFMPSVIIKPYINSRPQILCMWKKKIPLMIVYTMLHLSLLGLVEP